MCSTGSCKSTEAIWGLVSNGENGQRLHRLTFSSSLAQWLAGEAEKKWGMKMEVKRYGFKIGKRLDAGQASASGVYGIVSANKGMALRASLFQEGAEMMRDSSRDIHEMWLMPEDGL
jgi:hypothetical protein